MRIITISREFGSGGRELGKRLADELDFDYYDREIITAIAKAKGLDESYVEHALENHAWRNIPLTFRHSFTGIVMVQTDHVNLLVEQTKVIKGIAQAGRDCVIVGRNADVLLADEKPFSLFVCANMGDKIRRCMERGTEEENLTPRAVESNIRRIDKARAQSREMLTGTRWGQSSSYNLTVNTSGWSIKEITPAVAAFVRRWFEQKQG